MITIAIRELESGSRLIIFPENGLRSAIRSAKNPNIFKYSPLTILDGRKLSSIYCAKKLSILKK